MEQGEKFVLLVATDFSRRAAYALDYCCGLARQKGYELLLLHIHNPEIKSECQDEAAAYGHARQKLEKTIDEYSSRHFIEIKGLLEVGNIFSTITETAQRVKADMLVLPIHQKKGIQHLTGRFAFRIISSSPVPVMVVHHAQTPGSIDRLLVPLDLTEKLDENVARAIAFGRQHNSTLLLYSVAEADGFVSAMILKREMNLIRKRIERSGLQCETHLVQKQLLPVYRHIMDHGRKQKADAIILMARKEDDHDSLFVGSTAGRVIENSSLPVIVHAPARGFHAPRVFPAILRKLAHTIN
jgi:nucleotide-binding universal stress UspA family protein